MTDIGKGSAQKVLSLQDLAARLAPLRESKKIVLCHGVFDPLHIGHIRHFEEAKRSGEILVVTVTPDRFVNKGPDRPAFGEGLRAEAIAALSCVDFVAVNEWPTAEETIRLLRPHVYVKGPDYADAAKDRTGGITREEEAVRSVGGRLAITASDVFSASTIVNRRFSIHPPEVRAFLRAFSARHSSEEVIGVLERARPLRVLVVGETIIDEYQYCDAIGKSSKEPMLAVRYHSQEKFLGGILAVANHVANFCDRVGAVSFLGDRDSQEAFVRDRLAEKVDAKLLARSDSPTIVKRRFIESYFFTKMLEVYEFNDGALCAQDDEALCAALAERLSEFDVVIVVDFGHGTLSQKAIELLCTRARFLAVNAQSNAGNLGYHTISRYPRADYVSLAENEIRLEARDRHGDLREMVLDVSRRLGAARVAVTRGNKGCLVYHRDEGFFEVPALAGSVVDRMGAGDAFLAITALGAVQQAPMEVVGFIGNAAGAQKVATVGHRRSVERVPLLKHLESILK